MTYYLGLFDRLRTALQKSRFVDIGEFYVGEGLGLVGVSQIEEQFQISLAKPLKEFYAELNGAVVEWRIKPGAIDSLPAELVEDKESLAGSVYMYTLDEVLEGGRHLVGSPFEEGLSQSEVLERFCPFDRNVEEAFAGFIKEGGRVSEKIYYIRQYEEIVPLCEDLAEYFGAMLEARAYLWWQEAYLTHPAGKGSMDIYSYLPALFGSKAIGDIW